MNVRLFALAALFFSLGCQSSDRVDLASVAGTVTLDGRPVEQGTIMFEKTGARSATGQIKEGKIVDVTTYDVNDGAPIGAHRVAVFVTGVAKTAVNDNPGQIQKFDPNYMGGGSLIPSRYNDPAKSTLTADVKDDGPNEFKFELSSK